jgi:hypothetical protein
MAETAEQREMRKLVEFIESHGGSVTLRDTYTYYRPLKGNKEKAEQALNALEKVGRARWEPIPTRTQGGRPTRKLQLLQASASAKPPNLRGETLSCADADSGDTQRNAKSGKLIEAAEASSSDQLIKDAMHVFNATPAA